MLHHTPPATATPVRPGTFPHGPDTLLLNPAISARRWRRERLRSGLRPSVVLIGLSGGGLCVVTGMSGNGVAAVLAFGLGILAAVASTIAAWHGAARAITDHEHHARPCRLERRRGEFFLRNRDFTGLGRTTQATVRSVLAEVDELHRSPARAWIDPDLPGTAHRVVWEALSYLESTRAARTLVDDLAADPDARAGELVAAAREAIAVIDDAVEEIARYVHQCVVLTRAWEVKLRHQDLAGRARHTLAALPASHQTRRLCATAKALPENVFAYLTAARDLTGAGFFPWEPQPLGGLTQPRHVIPAEEWS